jgi:hypothetical protein
MSKLENDELLEAIFGKHDPCDCPECELRRRIHAYKKEIAAHLDKITYLKTQLQDWAQDCYDKDIEITRLQEKLEAAYNG